MAGDIAGDDRGDGGEEVEYGLMFRDEVDVQKWFVVGDAVAKDPYGLGSTVQVSAAR